MSGRARRRRPASAPRLFEPEELVLRPTGQARLGRLARRAVRTPDALRLREDEDDGAMRKLRGWGHELCVQFDLRYRSIDPETEGVNEHYGICYEDGTIRIRLRHAKTGRLLKESSLVDTLCHELAHLRYLDHSIRFRRLYAKILDAARNRGIYRPGAGEDPRPRQLQMFGEACGTRRERAKP